MSSKNTNQVIRLFDKYAQMYQQKYMSVEKYEETLNAFCALLTKDDANILELACGPGNITSYILSIRPEAAILATDLSEEMLKLAKINNPGIETLSLDCRNILLLNKKFDAIVCGFGLPYISKPDALKLIEDAAKALRPNGLLYLSTMEGEDSSGVTTSSSTNPEDTLTTYYHNATYLVRKMEDVGFNVKHESRISYTDDSNNDVTDLILIGKLE